MKSVILFLSFLFIAGCIPVKPLEYEPPPPADPYPAEQFGHTFTKEFYSVSRLGTAADQSEKAVTGDARSFRLSPKIVITYEPKHYQLYGKTLRLLDHDPEKQTGDLKIILLGIDKVSLMETPETDIGYVVSELRAENVYIKAFRPDGQEFRESDYLDAGFDQSFVYDIEKNMLKAGDDLYFAYKLQKTEAGSQKTD